MKASLKAIEECGQMPIPPYFKESRALDKERYQTVYANKNSTGRSVAAQNSRSTLHRYCN